MKDVNLVKAIHKARSILELGEGYTEESWKRAMDFLSKMAVAFYDLEPGRTFFPPAINPGPQGRINLYWSLQKFELLLNFPASPNQFPSCRGTDSLGVKIERELDDPEDYVAMARWMRYA